MRRHISALVALILAAPLLALIGPAGPAEAAGEAVKILSPSQNTGAIAFGPDGTNSRVHLTALASLTQTNEPPDVVSFWYSKGGNNYFFIGTSGSDFAELSWLRPEPPTATVAASLNDGDSIVVLAAVLSQANATVLQNMTQPVSKTQIDNLDQNNAQDSFSPIVVRTSPALEVLSVIHGSNRSGSVVVSGTVSGATSVEVYAAQASASMAPSYGAPLATVVPIGGTFSATIDLSSITGQAAIRARAVNGPAFSDDVHAVTVGGPSFVLSVSPNIANPAPADTVPYTATLDVVGGTATTVNLFATIDTTDSVYIAASVISPAGWDSDYECNAAFVEEDCQTAVTNVTRIRWSKASVAAADPVATFAYSVRVRAPNDPNQMPAGTQITSAVNATSDQAPGGPVTASAVTQSGLSVTKSVSTDTAYPGATFRYTILAQNTSVTAGNSSTLPVLTDNLGSKQGIDFILQNLQASAESNVSPPSPAFTCTFDLQQLMTCLRPDPSGSEGDDPRFARGEFVRVTVTATINPGFSGASITNTASMKTRQNPTAQGNLVSTCLINCPVNFPPVANANGPYSGIENQPVFFDASSSYDPDAPTDSITSYSWDFGDGGSGSGVAPSHTYANSGVFNVSLTVTDSFGREGMTTTVATIAEAPPPPEAGPNTFFFAEGTTLDGFREYLLIANPMTEDAAVNVTYFFDDGTAPLETALTVTARSRSTIDVVTVVGAGRTGVSIRVSSFSGIVAERSIFFERGLPNGLINGSHSVLGERAARTSWVFGEGSTLPGFQEYFTVQNPEPTPTVVSFTFGIEGGSEQAASLDVPGGSRRTLDVNAILGSVVGHSTRVSSTEKVLVERPMYVRRAVGDDGVEINGGHVAFGTTPTKTLYFAEGTVLPNFAEYLTLANADQTNTVIASITYFLADGSTIEKEATVAPGSRRTVRVFDLSDPAGIGRTVSDPVGRGVSVRVTTSAFGGVVAERPMYFHQAFTAGGTEVNDAHGKPGAPALSKKWSFAEGSTLEGFFPFLTILNSGSDEATVVITYTPDTGAPIERTITIGPTSRRTVQVYGLVTEGGIGGEITGFGIFVTSTRPVLVERPFYVDRVLPGLPRINGGSVVIGLPD